MSSKAIPKPVAEVSTAVRDPTPAAAIPREMTAREATEKDAADLLYGHGIGGLFVSLLASSGLGFMARTQIRSGPLYAWWTIMTLVLVCRAIDLALFRLSKHPSTATGRAQIQRFGIGLVATALVWGSFPLAFFSGLDNAGRTFTAIIVSAMVGGSASVLSPSNLLSIIYCACLLLPTSILFLLLGGRDNTFLGILGCTFFVVMSASARVTHRATMAAIRLSHHNRALAADMQAERQRTETANLELRVAQQELSEINRSLESRIQARTVQLAQEIVEKERFAKDLAYLASTDPLTGIPNRLTIGKHLAEAMNHARSAGQPLAVLFIDLDKFKEVNDVMGHWAGDRVLHTVARRLSECVLPTAELARWGGDEFVVILPGPLTTNDVMEFANTLRNRLCNHIEIDPGIVTIDATVGIALFPEHGETQEELIRAADMAMYDGKERRAKIQLFDASLSQRLTERHLFERALRSAVGSPAFSLVFQPIYGSRSGRCEIVEALTRWQHPRRGAIPPSKFIPVAERTGEINAIGRWVLREACRTAASWRGDNPPAVSVNISAVQIQSGSLVPDVLFALEESSLPPNRLHLELTESVFAGDHNVINPVLQYLRSKGLSILLDDFGTGFSCLSYLRHLPIDMIKIDKSFVESVCVDSGPIIQTIITTAQTFGLKTVAEGVETSQQASRIRELHANYLQGFLFSPALPADKLDL